MTEDSKSPIPPEEGGSVSQELAYRLHQQELSAAFGLFALKTHDIPALLQEATRVCAVGLQTEFCKVMEYLPSEGVFMVVAGVGWQPGVIGVARVGADVESPTGFAFMTERPVISNQLSSESRFRTPELLARHGVRRAINVVIRGEDSRFGILEVDSSEEGRFTEADISFLQGFANLLGVALERQKAEESLKNTEVLLRRTVERQEMLAQEMSHRVKNSLALVAALLSLQRRGTSNPELRQNLTEAESRVQTIARVHDHLWRSSAIGSVDLQPFLTELCEQLRSSSPQHQLTATIASTPIVSDKAICLGILVNELVTNSFKHAPLNSQLAVVVLLEPTANKEMILKVRDNGAGFPANFDASSSRSLGMKLILSMASQLGGTLSRDDLSPGTQFTLSFSL
jgi:two-component sensor histidine kinase